MPWHPAVHGRSLTILSVLGSMTVTVWDSTFAASIALPSGLTGSWIVRPPNGAPLFGPSCGLWFAHRSIVLLCTFCPLSTQAACANETHVIDSPRKSAV